MFALILFMTGVFFTMSRTYMGSVFRQFATVVRYSEADQWASLLSYYYKTHNHSWANVEDYVDRVERNQLAINLWSSQESLVILDNHRQVVYVTSNTQQSVQDIIRIGSPVPVYLGAHNVATIYVFDRGLNRLNHLQNRILSTMTKAIIIGAIITMGAAMLLALWLTRLLTLPLNQLLRAIREMAKGNLRPQLVIRSGDEYGQVSAAFNQMSTQLSAVEEVRRHLVADVAHELRTPLTIMQGQLELIQQGVLKPDMETLLPISDECIRLTRLVDELHQLSLAEAGALHLQRSDADVGALLRRIVDNFQFEAEDKGIQLSVLEEAEPLLANLDASRITQVFINLIGNAIRYTPDGGEVRVDAKRVKSAVVVSVSDTGPGINPEHLPFLFNRFYRVDADRSRTGGGMGLGLAIAKEFVEAHGGSIKVDSRMGDGTVFTVVLPLRAGDM